MSLENEDIEMAFVVGDESTSVANGSSKSSTNGSTSGFSANGSSKASTNGSETSANGGTGAANNGSTSMTPSNNIRTISLTSGVNQTPDFLEYGINGGAVMKSVIESLNFVRLGAFVGKIEGKVESAKESDFLKHGIIVNNENRCKIDPVKN